MSIFDQQYDGSCKIICGDRKMENLFGKGYGFCSVHLSFKNLPEEIICRDANRQYIRTKVEKGSADFLSEYYNLENELVTLKRDLRQLLFEYGVPSNMLWTTEDIVKAFRILLLMHFEGGRLPV